MALKAVKGTRDILSPDVKNWVAYEKIARKLFNQYGFDEIRTPIFEYTEVFARGIGEDTDIVHKEMYTFQDRKGRSITLRPENTASVVRAYIEHKMHLEPGVKRLFYIGPMFRYERPQKGRYRQFYQTGVEVLKSSNPFIDAETIEMVVRLLKTLGLQGLRVEINSVGCEKCRPNYKEALKSYLNKFEDNLCSDCKRRKDTNPLRVLDCKVKTCKDVTKEAPNIQNHLCDDCKSHQEKVFKYLSMLSVDYELKASLVRGLDYYTKTVFEVIADSLGSQNAVLGGGRYDKLVKELGGQSTPAFGFALGMDRLMMIIGERQLENPVENIYILPVSDNLDYCVKCSKMLKDEGLPAIVVTESKSLKSGLKFVNKVNGKYVLIAGEDEENKGIVIFKNMEKGKQTEIKYENLIKAVKDEIGKQNS
jgi:histidyl-tRNA synthetase